MPSDDILDGLASLTYAEAEGVLETDAANAIALEGANESAWVRRCRPRFPRRRDRRQPMSAVAAAEPVVEAVQPADCEVIRARPGRQRSEAADQAILSATLDLLAIDGYGGLTMAAVIARSGVSSATLYRRWPTKQQLVAAAVASLHAEIIDVDTGSLDGDLAAVVGSIAASMSVSATTSPSRCSSSCAATPSSSLRSTRSSSCRGWP